MVSSCLLIILIKCLKGHKSLGSLCSVLKTLIVSGNGPTDRPSKGQTRSPIELFGTAKKELKEEKWMVRVARLNKMSPVVFVTPVVLVEVLNVVVDQNWTFNPGNRIR